MIEAVTQSAAREKELLQFWFDTVRFDEESEGLPVLEPENDDEPRALVNSKAEIRHLPGKHNQQTHGKGGSGAGNGATSNDPIPPENVGGSELYRGMVISESIPMASAERIADGKATEDDIMQVVNKKDIGGFWYDSKDEYSVDDAKEFAAAEETANKYVPDAKESAKLYNEPVPDDVFFELPVVFTGIGPKDFSTNNNIDITPEGMGNSFLPSGSQVHVTNISYSPDGKTWVNIPTKMNVDVGGNTGYGMVPLDERTLLTKVDFHTLMEELRKRDPKNPF